MFVIEDIPHDEAFCGPAPIRGGRRSLYPFANLKVGQSFSVPPERVHAAAVAASYFKSKTPGWDYTRRDEGMGTRFFRVR